MKQHKYLKKNNQRFLAILSLLLFRSQQIWFKKCKGDNSNIQSVSTSDTHTGQ